MIRAIEVSFAVPVELTREEERALLTIIDTVALRHQPAGHVHWLSGHGSKPHFSQNDAAFLGKPIDPTAPETGEPTFDSEVLYFETCARETLDGERIR